MAVNIFARIANKAKLAFSGPVEQVVVTELEFNNRRMAEDFVREIGVDNYPPEGPGNRPPSPYWQRGAGRVLSSGTINPASQQYGESWQINEVKTPFGGTVRAENPATYTPFLIDDQKQASWHKRNGWKTISAVAAILGIQIRKEGESTHFVVDGGKYMVTTREKIAQKIQSIFNR